MNFGAEHPTSTCALHFGVPIPEGHGSCVYCELAGVRVVTTDPESVAQTITAIESTGGKYLSKRSRAVLVFERPEGPAMLGDFVPKPPKTAASRKQLASKARVGLEDLA